MAVYAHGKPAYTWTAGALIILKHGFNCGLTATQIANSLPPDDLGTKVTRSAVCGKLHRMGMTRKALGLPRAVNGSYVVKPPGPRPKYRPSLASRAALPNGASYTTEALLPSLLQLKIGQCHWPVGDPLTADFHFCGVPTACKDDIYCTAHKTLAKRD